MSELHVLKDGDRGDEVRTLQEATNRRLRSRDLDALVVKEDGDLGRNTLAAAYKAAWALGARVATYEAITDNREISVGVQQMIRNPGRRSPEQIDRGKARMARLRAERKRRAAQPKSGRSRAVNAFLAKVGTKEQPAGTNKGGLITAMEVFWGFGAEPWCGISCGYHAVKFGGVQGLRSDIASVAAIEGHARAKHEPYGHWQSSPEGALPGSLVVIGGHGVHVGMLVRSLSGGRAETVEGNTSATAAGSQSNGGCIAHKIRSDAEIFGVATMNYPG
ncbi:MAG TPA: hypothetical protein VGO80_19430 [Solirubrobacteraceae bacterium]|jgi:hypothetical protein|nr:hypothetical protein [Solirubrobacteraceae bacterium]